MVNCRRVSNLLSAYLDSEMTGSEMLEIREHLDACPSCRAEYQSLRDTKHLLSSLALRAPRGEFEMLLGDELRRAANPLERWMPSWLAAWRGGAIQPPRPRPLMATAALSLAGLLMATATVETPGAGSGTATAAARIVLPDVYSPHVAAMPAALPAVNRSGIDMDIRPLGMAPAPYPVAHSSSAPLVDSAPAPWSSPQDDNSGSLENRYNYSQSYDSYNAYGR